MSRWTHIVAAIDVDTFIESDTIQQDVEALLNSAPKITGSESDAEVFVNVPSGYNVSCTYSNGTYHEFQTRVVITVIGDLRDRDRAQTKQEWLDFKKYIYKTVNGN